MEGEGREVNGVCPVEGEGREVSVVRGERGVPCGG